MTERRCCGRPAGGARAALRLGHAVAVAVLLLAPLATVASAQQGAAETRRPPPDTAPISRLTVTPADFERWLAGTPEQPDIAAVPEAPPPSLVTAPPPPPRLVAPPPPPAALTPPPPAPEVPDTPALPAPRSGGDAPKPVPGPGPAAPPPAPLLTPPEAPQIATLPPDSRATTPVPEPPAVLPRPAEIRILYATEATDLPAAAHEELDGLAEWLRAHPEVRVQIVGYASATTPSGSEARRRSLFRTLAVRTYLIENGVMSTRMDVRALGARTEEEPKDRVEVRLPPS